MAESTAPHYVRWDQYVARWLKDRIGYILWIIYMLLLCVAIPLSVSELVTRHAEVLHHLKSHTIVANQINFPETRRCLVCGGCFRLCYDPYYDIWSDPPPLQLLGSTSTEEDYQDSDDGSSV